MIERESVCVCVETKVRGRSQETALADVCDMAREKMTREEGDLEGKQQNKLLNQQASGCQLSCHLRGRSQVAEAEARRAAEGEGEEEAEGDAEEDLDG